MISQCLAALLLSAWTIRAAESSDAERESKPAGRHLPSIAPVFMADSRGVFQMYKGNHLDGTPRHGQHHGKPQPVSRHALAVDLLYMYDASVYGHFVTLSDGGTSKHALHMLARYANVVALEVDRILMEELQPLGRHVHVNPIGVYVSRWRSTEPWLGSQGDGMYAGGGGASESAVPQAADGDADARPDAVRYSTVFIGPERGDADDYDDGDDAPESEGERRVLDVHVALELTRQWMVHGDGAALPRADHAVLITKHELARSNGSLSVEGLAWPQSICSKNGFSLAVVEDVGLQRTAWSIVHELVHSLGAVHHGHGGCSFESPHYGHRFTFDKAPAAENGADDDDDESRDASGSQTSSGAHGYLLHSANDIENISDKGHRLSKCAVKQVDEYIIKSWKFVGCLRQTAAPWRGSVRSRLLPADQPGQTIGADEQCRILFGKGYKFCNHKAWYATQVCAQLYCVHKTDYRRFAAECRSVWHYMPALERTTCGDGRWCRRGRCVADELAPQGHGCRTAVADAAFCDDVLKQLVFACDVPSIAKRCCLSCGEQRARHSRRTRRRHGHNYGLMTKAHYWPVE